VAVDVKFCGLTRAEDGVRGVVRRGLRRRHLRPESPTPDPITASEVLQVRGETAPWAGPATVETIASVASAALDIVQLPATHSVSWSAYVVLRRRGLGCGAHRRQVTEGSRASPAWPTPSCSMRRCRAARHRNGLDLTASPERWTGIVRARVVLAGGLIQRTSRTPCVVAPDAWMYHPAWRPPPESRITHECAHSATPCADEETTE
jgi:hypothetical protein